MAIVGFQNDSVALRLRGSQPMNVEQYSVRVSVLQQPAAFSVVLGWNKPLKEFADSYPPRTPFELFVGDLLQFRGLTDGYDMQADDSGSTLTIPGRDILQLLADSFVTKDVSFKDTSCQQMVRRAMDEVGLKDVRLDVSNIESLQKRLGKKVQYTPETERQNKKRSKPIAAKVGDKWYEFLLKELKREGLFLWAGTDGQFILGAPDGSQAPSYRLVRKYINGEKVGNIERGNHRNNTSKRFSVAKVTGGGGGKGSKTFKSSGDFVDDEMVNWGYNRPIVFKDRHAVDREQSEFFARRKLAESRREGWSLSYDVAGHTTQAIGGNSRVVWTPDTTVDVDDEKFGIRGTFWIESVDYRRSGSGTTTSIVLQRPQDLIFADDA